ncbi:hypothetical protein B5M42_001925 [Paenibacillus athensensis]|uniref:hypothetical protein n=1 Tax=Paenibacillus athensensis TaxID=1967502 RepID=UPI001ADDC1DB|nr:hypothetical protein [Paenibacillus athensensis]MCD1257595.1 hypothetical protein [Paenibacillus athensensis]
MKLACLHAHYSNIEYIQKAASAVQDCELIHYVDPGLIHRMNHDPGFTLKEARHRMKDQLEWIIQTKADALLITCTQYIALLEESKIHMPIPLIKIDDPLFANICSSTKPQILVFTNPSTVDATMKRLQAFAKQRNQSFQLPETRIIPHSFELLMLGEKHAYLQLVNRYIKQLLAAEADKRVIAAQLSMSGAADEIAKENSQAIITPVDCLTPVIQNLLHHIQNSDS